MSDHQFTYDQLCAHARETALLSSVASVLEWEEQTYMPPAGGAYRAEQLAALATMTHERATAPFFASEDEFRRAVIDAMRRPDDLVLGEETATAARIRFTAAVRGAIAEFAGEHLAVVSHGTVIALLVAHASGGDPVDLWRQQRMPWAIRVGLPGLVPMVG